MKDFELCITPVENYKAPEIPKFGDNNSALLKKIPSRWQRNAKVIAGLGLIGIFALSGCGHTPEEFRPNGIEHNLWYTQGSYSGYSEADLLVRLHTGGRGVSFYMVHLTEQEALGIIRARLEAAGLVFDATPPGYTIDLANTLSRHDSGEVGLDLFDAEKGIGVAQVSWLGDRIAFMPHESEVAWWIEERFAEQVPNIIVRAFYDTGLRVGGGRLLEGRLQRRLLRREVRESRPILVRQLINQADIFIAHLQSEGILERFPDINVTINGTPFNTDDYPILINNQKMVPAIELFEALGMRAVRDRNQWRTAIIGVKDDAELIWVSPSGGIMVTRNGNREWLDDTPPVIVRNDTILVPLQFVADLVGATIEWDEDTRTIIIAY